jgi:hypothetical protein
MQYIPEQFSKMTSAAGIGSFFSRDFLTTPIVMTAITVLLVIVVLMIYAVWSSSRAKKAAAAAAAVKSANGKAGSAESSSGGGGGNLVSVTLQPQATANTDYARPSYEYYSEDNDERSGNGPAVQHAPAKTTDALTLGPVPAAAVVQKAAVAHQPAPAAAAAVSVQQPAPASQEKVVASQPAPTVSSGTTEPVFPADQDGRARRNVLSLYSSDYDFELPPLNAAGVALASATDPELLSLGSTSGDSLADRRRRSAVAATTTKPAASSSSPTSRRGKIARRSHSKHGVVSDAISNRKSLAYVLKRLKEGTLAAFSDDDPRPAPELLDENQLALVKQSLGDGRPDSEANPSLLAAMHRWNVTELREAIDRFVQETEQQLEPLLPLREAFDEFAPEDMEQLEEALLADTNLA